MILTFVMAIVFYCSAVIQCASPVLLSIPCGVVFAVPASWFVTSLYFRHEWQLPPTTACSPALTPLFLHCLRMNKLLHKSGFYFALNHDVFYFINMSKDNDST